MPVTRTLALAVFLLLAAQGPALAQTSKDYVTKQEEAAPAADPLTTPLWQDQEIASWVQKIIPEIMTFTPENHLSVLNAARAHFNEKGHSTLIGTLQRDKTIETIKQNKLSISIGATGIPRICRQQVQNGAYQWKLEVPKLYIYKASGQKDMVDPRYINITIIRSNDEINRKKVAIKNWVTFTAPQKYASCDYVKQLERRAMLEGMPASTKDAVETLFTLEEENKALKKQIESLTKDAR